MFDLRILKEVVDSVNKLTKAIQEATRVYEEIHLKNDKPDGIKSEEFRFCGDHCQFCTNKRSEK